MALRLSNRKARELNIDQGLIPPRVTHAQLDPDGMNKTERRYAARLDMNRSAGFVRRYWFEAVKFRIGLPKERCWYTPDFLIERPDGVLVVHEVKGPYIREDARVKLQSAAAQFPIPFYLCQWVGGQWQIIRLGRGD